MWNNLISETFPISNGIKQGGISCLRDCLIYIYVDILSRKLNTHKIGCCINNVIINHLHYADDLVLISPSVMGLQSLLTECELFSEEYDLKFNEKKSYFLYFKPNKFKLNPNLSVYMNGVKIIPQQKCKYLGHIICDDLCDNGDIKRQLR